MAQKVQEVELEPGWLAHDVKRATVRVKELKAERTKSARPVTLVTQ